jgi:arylsulfatase A-like enzyme/cytochrome c-type biogenesis protein CcmH/NrfG
VLLVTLDTTRADHLGCYGASFAATPNLDALAVRGTRFDRAISPTPLTLPSHATLFSGRVPRRHGVRNNSLFRLGREPELLAEVLRGHGYHTEAFVSSVVLDRITGLDRGFDHYDDTVRVGPREAFQHEERAAIQTNEAVLGRLDELTEPFFLWVHYFDPHLPYVPPQPFRGQFPARPYDGEIAFMDQQFGALLQAVKTKSDSVLVVVAGDHGESLGQHGEAAHGVFVYQATQRVPLILAGPGVPQARVVKETVGLVDLAPTVLDLLALPALEDADGRSLASLFRNGKLERRGYELESFFQTYAYGWAPLRALIRDGYKFVLAPRNELYDLDADPGEVRNVAGSNRKRAAAMQADLRALIDADAPPSASADPALAEQARRLETLGYVGGRGDDDEPSIDPKNGIAWIEDLEAGRRACQIGDPATGIEALERLLVRNPRNVPALLALAICHLGSGRPDKAVEADLRAETLSPDDDLVQFNLANALAARERLQPDAPARAPLHYERALELNPRFADAYVNFASYLERHGSDAQSHALLSRARSAGVRDPRVETSIAALDLKRGEVERAKEALRRALLLHPGDAAPLEALALIAERQGYRAEAAAYFLRLLAVTPAGDPRREALQIKVDSLSSQD